MDSLAPRKDKEGCRIHRADQGRITTRIADRLGFWEGYGAPLDPPGRYQLQEARLDHVGGLASREE